MTIIRCSSCCSVSEEHLIYPYMSVWWLCFFVETRQPAWPGSLLDHIFATFWTKVIVDTQCYATTSVSADLETVLSTSQLPHWVDFAPPGGLLPTGVLWLNQGVSAMPGGYHLSRWLSPWWGITPAGDFNPDKWCPPGTAPNLGHCPPS
jgi:hypothetical protein